MKEKKGNKEKSQEKEETDHENEAEASSWYLESETVIAAGKYSYHCSLKRGVYFKHVQGNMTRK
jgi:hypothetical protein